MARGVKLEPNSGSGVVGGGGGERRETRSRRSASGTSSSSCSSSQQQIPEQQSQRQQKQPAKNQRPPRPVPKRPRDEGDEEETDQDAAARRALRSRYLAVKTMINEKKDDLIRPDSDNFNAIIHEVESLHEQVHKPREQVADAEALLDITNSLVTSVRAHRNEGLTPADFINSLLSDFGQQGRASSSSAGARNMIMWKELGLAVSHIFQQGKGCCTMIGPMNTEMKLKRTYVRKKHVKPTEKARPEELNDNKEERTDTDKNMAVMFDTLKKNRRVRLEKLILNRTSFAQTVENLFALSFLVKDGRAEMTVNKDGHHIVSPRNAPAANEVSSGQVSYSHFVFRFDFRDWKLMCNAVEAGEELMPHRNPADDVAGSSSPQQLEHHLGDLQEPVPTTPIRKLCRNRGLVLQEQQVVVNDSPESQEYDSPSRAAIRRGKRKIR